IAEAFEELLSYVLRDFVDFWFVHLSGSIEEKSFPSAVDHIIRTALLNLKGRLEDKDLMSIVLNRLMPIITLHISEFREAEVSLRGRSLERSVTQSDELDLLLASQFRGGKLHPALTTAAVTTKPTEIAYLRQVIDRIMPYIFDKKDIQSNAVALIIREMATCAVLQPTFDMLADPDFWNQTIDIYFSAAFLGTGLEEAWDEQEEDADTKRIFGFGSTKMGRQTFQDFLKMIESEKNLLDLKRVRNDIITQIRKKKALTFEDVNAYVNRLSVAKKRVDKRIALLSGENYEKRSPTSQLFGSRKQSTTFTSQTTGYTLYDILTNTAGLSYFMEFMDRRGDMVKLQFWLIVEGFKNYDTSDNSPQKRDEKTFFQDIKMVHEMYFADASPHRLPISENLSRDLMDAIQRAQIDLIEENESVFSETVQEMGRRLYRIQQSIFWQIEKEHFLYFKRSDLYFKYLATSPNSAPDTLPERHEYTQNKSISTLPRREGSIKITKPQSFQRPSPLILYGTRGIKSSMAMPVQNDYTLPSWKSSGGTNTISEVEHDQIGPLTPRGSIKSQEQQEIHSSASSTKAPSGDNVHLAPPGDLLLASKVKQISEDVKKLMQEEALVDALIRKSEARNEVESLRLLRKIKSACRQDIQQMKYQKSQYELQESENVLERTKVSITNSTIGSDIHGEFALYVIEIHQLGTEGNYTSGWIVTRRYSEFFTLHQKLKDHYAAVKMLDFPVKWPLLKLQRSFVETRRISLERYLRRLLEDKLICQSDELRVFLSQQNVYVPGPKDNSDVDYEFAGFMKHIYKTVAAGFDDMFIGPSMLDLITQRLGEQVMEFSYESDMNDPNSTFPHSHSLSNSFGNVELSNEALKPVENEGITRFTEPLCDLFIEMFELKEKNNWLRRQAVVIILQQIFGGTIERKLRESMRFLESEPMILFYFRRLTDTLWPEGASLSFKPPRRPEEKQHTREEANRKLSTWLPDLLGSMVGRQNSRRGARRLFSVLQNKRLNQDLVYTLFDEILYELF
ncbi:hypothetical protein PHYBLDRAFT_86166, partial [Phycomyces blakesleeanus NRRL 1555(-)]